ncbi:MAG TPA: c-type cytochrome domain-containing protein, partial [Pirellula sp.]|nr:c-type cytochrome domain-containing protein [Pirellula sp.]
MRSTVVKRIAVTLVSVLTSISFLNPKATQADRDIASSSISREVYTILNRSCFECHGPARQEGGLRLDSHKAITAGGDSGVVFDVNAPDASELLRRIRLPKGHEGVMPNRGALLTTREIARIHEWITLGAPWSADAAGGSHWAYISPSKSIDSQPNAKPSLNPIDYLVQEKLESENLTGS